MVVVRDKVCRWWIDTERNNSGEREKKKRAKVYHDEGERGFAFCIEERYQMG